MISFKIKFLDFPSLHIFFFFAYFYYKFYVYTSHKKKKIFEPKVFEIFKICTDLYIKRYY